MLTLRERIDHHARLMPYALSALSDSSKDVQMAALKLMDDLGAQYEQEHQQELKVLSACAAILLNRRVTHHSYVTVTGAHWQALKSGLYSCMRLLPNPISPLISFSLS